MGLTPARALTTTDTPTPYSGEKEPTLRDFLRKFKQRLAEERRA